MNMNEHLSQKEIQNLKSGKCSIKEKLIAMEHIGECELCADIFANNYEEKQLLNLSPDFAHSVLRAVEHVKNNDNIRKIKGKRELCFYKFKVSLAASIALVLLFTGTFNYGLDVIGKSKIANTDLSRVNTITENLRGFSDKLIQLEVNNDFKGEV